MFDIMSSMRNIDKILRTNKGWVTIDEISSIIGISLASTKVFCSRATARGSLIRVRRGLYIIPRWVGSAESESLFRLSNQIISPSYISLLPALSFFGVSTQVPVGVYESICETRSKEYNIEDFEFRYVRFPKQYWFGYIRVKDFFIAEPEKALVDSIYLASIGRYSLDISAIDLRKIDKEKLVKYLKRFPKRTQKFFSERFSL